MDPVLDCVSGIMLILRALMSGNQLLPSTAALRCVALLFHQGWLSGLLRPPHASLISNESQHRQGQQSLCSESQPIKLKDRGVLLVQRCCKWKKDDSIQYPRLFNDPILVGMWLVKYPWPLAIARCYQEYQELSESGASLTSHPG